MRRFFIVFFLLLLFIAALIWFFPFASSLYQTAYIISHNVPSFPQWFEWGKYEVSFQQVSLRDKGVLDLYLPKEVEQTSFVILVPGFTPEGSRDPRIVRLAHSFARAGIGAAVPDSPSIREQRFSRQDIDLVKETFWFLKEQPYTHEKKIGLSGFSIAGAYALRATAELGSEPLFVHSLGGFYDLGGLMVEILSERAILEGKERVWRPDAFPREIAKSILSKELGADKTEQLFLKEDMSTKEAQVHVDSLSFGARETLKDISPAPLLSQMKTRVFLMHDKNDLAIPVEESQKIKNALPKNIPVSFSKFSFFQHVVPKDVLSRDVFGLFWQVFRMMMLFY